MMANNDMSRWCVLYTAPKSERKLVQRLHAAGYMAFCPMQIVFKKWKGQTKEVFAPLFPDCVFVEEAAGVEHKKSYIPNVAFFMPGSIVF